MRLDNNQKAFIALLQAGLWEKEVELRKFGTTDFEEIMRLAEEQSVVGLITAGMERATDKSVPKAELLQFIGQTLQIEEQNKAMNSFIGVVVDAMRKEKIHTTLIKGQGVAQCYVRPLWRTAGDVDFFLDEDNYDEAKVFFAKMCSSVEPEKEDTKHIGFTVDPWLVELHATMHTGLKKSVDRVIDEVRRSVFNEGNVRAWDNNGVVVFIPSPDNDIIIVFTHFLGHFCFGGIGLKQICDLCRLLWVNKDEIDHKLLQKRLKQMGLMTEWKVFSSLMVNWLGMPKEAMPFYTDSSCYKRKASRVCARILRSGNLGVNVDDSYRSRQPKWKANLITFWRRTGEFFGLLSLFPLDAPRFFWNYMVQKVKK